MHVLPFIMFFCCPLSTIVFTSLSARGLGQSGAKKIFFGGQILLLLVLRRIRFLKLSFRNGGCLWDFEIQKNQLWQY